MEIIGLEKDYYLVGNDIYIRVKGTSKESQFLDITFTNMTTGNSLKGLRPYPNLQNEYKFNVCMPVRALFPEPETINTPNSIQRIAMTIVATLTDGTTETTSLTKLFVRGGKQKNMATEWNLEDGTILTTAPFPRFIGVPELPHGIHKIAGDKVIEHVPKERFDVLRRSVCSPTYVRFLNSLGGYEWWCFEQRVDNDEGKAGKTKTLPALSLKANNMRQLSTTQSREFMLISDMPIEYYNLAVELINSTDIYIFNPSAPKDDPEARFERVFLNGTNKLERNTISKRVSLELKLYLPNYITREI